MAASYTPSLTVSAWTKLRKERRLPAKGDVLVCVGDKIEAQTIVARTQIPGYLQTVRVAEALGVDPEDAIRALLVKQGDQVSAGQVVAESKSFWGLFKSQCKSPIDGTVEMVTSATGHIGIRSPFRLVELNAYLDGVVSEVLPNEGIVVEASGALVQGIFGVGGERYGDLVVPDDLRSRDIVPGDVSKDLAGKILVGGAGVTGVALQAAGEYGLSGVVAGAVIDTDLIGYLGFDIGVAITGQEDVPTTVIVTEGFGDIQMADRTWRLLKSLEGQPASMNGATQIRAGVIRPEIIVPGSSLKTAEPATESESGLRIGAVVRVIREPYFGEIGKITALPPEPIAIETGAVVRILEARLLDNRIVRVPRANIEIIAE